MYLLVFKYPESDDLLLSTTEDSQIEAFHTFSDVYDKFKSYEKSWTSGPSGSYGGAIMSMMNMQPKAVEYNDPAETLAKYVVNPQIVKLSIFGTSATPRGVRLKAALLNDRKVVDIWKESMIRSGIYDPTKSDLVGKQQELSF